MNKKISFIGLGAMGGPMATNIIKKGIKLFVYDIDENKKNKRHPNCVSGKWGERHPKCK